jgi:signal transduction histidine kinase/CheY-like chemotaxis protein/HPt (histidine-containing phosphotransfer) domain-containing protein
VFEEDALPATPSVGFTLRLDGEVLLVVVITARSPFERHAMLTSMVKQVAVQLTRVAERERAALELEAARDTAMEASRLKSEFLATMSHEIRTPMNGVIGLNELMLRTRLDDHQRRLAHGAQVAGRALMSLINDILDFSKIEAGQLEIEVVEFELRPVIDQVLAINGQTAHDRGVTLEVDVADDVPARLVGDPTRLGQVIGNLVSNAVKFTADGSVRIAVRTEPVQEAGTDGTMRLRVEVRDTGIGIDRRVLERLFEPFRQADVSTTRTFGGTGLGLAISRQLVEAMGGEIGVASSPGDGSTFWFTALLDPAGDRLTGIPRSDATRARDGGRGTGHVLVVEDNDINQLVALGLLEALGFTGEVAANGEEAVAKVASGTYDVVLMDLQMPGMDGYTASRLIRSHEPEGLRVPIIAMTASAIEGVRERCLEAGMDDFLTKPVRSEHLESLLRAHLRSSAYSPADAPPLPPPPAILEVSRLEELGELGPSAVALVERAIDNFVANMDATVTEIQNAVAAGDSETLGPVAHRLKGSALNLGANRLAEILLELELLGDEGAAWAGAPMLDDLHDTAAATVTALLDYRARASTHA